MSSICQSSDKVLIISGTGTKYRVQGTVGDCQRDRGTKGSPSCSGVSTPSISVE